MTTRLDHLVIGATSLQQGVDYIRQHLGVDIPPGGEHPAMGTHNHVMQLGHEVFLEVLAVNPTAPPPPRLRWYGLDDPFVAAQLARGPQLLTWVINVPDIAACLAKATVDLGEAVPLSRGALSWTFGLPEDGRLLAGGAVPYVIQWHTADHPARGMAHRGCTLQGLEIAHPHPPWLEAVLTAMGAQGLVAVRPAAGRSTPQLRAHLHTPNGHKILAS
ncbi:MAG: VOC family protein [Candidatus Competibacterales bacterium]